MMSRVNYGWSSSLPLISTFVAAMAIAIFSIQSGYAQTVEPMIFELEPLGSRASEAIRIDNPNSGPMTLEIIPMRVVLDEFGKETNVPAEEDFLIYPPQTVVPADSTQLIRVKYVGDPTIDHSKAYRISINQLPVDLQTDTSGIAILTNFMTLVNVSPKKSKPKLAITEITAQDNDQWQITVENSGNGFGSLSRIKSWELESTDSSAKTKKLDNEEMSAFLPQTLILPNSIMRWTMPAIEGFNPVTSKIKIKL